MESIVPENTSKRRPVLAGFLSVAATGLGHIYCGHFGKGIILFFISFIFAPIISSAIVTSRSTVAFIAVILSIVLLVFVFFYAIIDSVKIAIKADIGYRLKEYNKGYIYLLFIIVSFTYPTNLANTIRKDVLQPYKIASSSMTPGLLKKDYVMLNKMTYKQKSPEVGDIVIFTNPNKRHMDYIKRIVAMPGDTVEIKENILYINDAPLPYKSIDKKDMADIKNQVDGVAKIEVNRTAQYKIMLSGKTGENQNFDKQRVPNGHCFVLGDNRNMSMDSRAFGMVPLSDIKGRVDYIYIPAESWARFGKYQD